MNHLRTALLLSAALALLPLLGTAWAQDEEAGNTSEPAAVPDSVAVPDGDEAEAPEVTSSTRPPDDYEASEQISEDLAVSFPVDI